MNIEMLKDSLTLEQWNSYTYSFVDEHFKDHALKKILTELVRAPSP